MPKLTKNVVDANLRSYIFNDLLSSKDDWDSSDYFKINDRQYGIILTDDNGVERYCRIGIIVAEEREDITARELMQSEIDAYNTKQTEKAEKAKAKAEKAARDKAAREAKEKEGE